MSNELDIMKDENIINREYYILTNINSDGYYVIRLTDNKEYVVYKEGSKDYIKKDNKKIYLSKEVQQMMLASIREYERYGI